MSEAQTFPFDPNAEGTQGLIETPMFPDSPLPSVPGNLEEVATQAALVESSHSGKTFEAQKTDTVNTIQTLGMDETRRSIAGQEKAVEIKVAEQAVRKSPSEDTAAYYKSILDKHQGPPSKQAMETAVVDIITPATRKEYYTDFNKRENSKDLAARNILFSTLTESGQNATFWEKALVFGRVMVPFLNSRSLSTAAADALGIKNTFGNWLNPDQVINEFRSAYAQAPEGKKVEMIQALIHGLERTSSLFGDKNAAQIAMNLQQILEQSKSESVENTIFDVAGLPLVTTARLLTKGARVAAQLGKPANVALRAGNKELAVDLLAQDAITGSKVSGMSNDEIAHLATSMNMTPTELSFQVLKVPQTLQERLGAMARGVRKSIGDTLMPSSITPVQIAKGAEYFDDLYSATRNKAVYEYTPTAYKEGYFTGEIKWQSPEGNPFQTREAAEQFGKDLQKQGEAVRVGEPWQHGEEPTKIGKEQRVYAKGGEMDVTGKVVGGSFPPRPSDTQDTFWLFGAVKRDKQGRYSYTQQEYAVPGQSWVFKETIQNPLPLESVGTHTLADVSSRNWWNFGIPALAASIVTVTQRGLGRSAQAKIARGLEAEYKAAVKGLSAKENDLVNKALIDGDALSNQAGAFGHVFDAVELGAQGLSEKAIESYYRQRILRDTMWLFRNKQMVQEFRAGGFIELAFDGNEFAQALHTPVKPMDLGTIKSLNTQGKIGKVLNTVDGVVINLTSENIDALYAGGGQVVKLYKPQVIGGRKYTHVIVDPKQTKFREITTPLPYRPGEFSRVYTDEYFITLKKTMPDEFDRKPGMAGYDGEVTRTVRTAHSAKDAKAFALDHNEALRIAFSEGIDDATKLQLLEQRIGKYTDPQEFLQNTKTGKITQDEIFDFHYNKETHSYLQDTVDEGLTNGRLFYSKRGEKLLSTDPNRVNTLDIKQSLGVELANISRFITSKDIRVDAIEKWMNTFGDGLVNPSHNKMADFTHQPLDASKIKEGLLAKESKLSEMTSSELLKFAESERAYIKNQLHIRTQAQKTNAEAYRRVSEWIERGIRQPFRQEKLGSDKLADWFGPTMRQSSVPDFLRQMNFTISLAAGNVAQLIVQANGMAISMARHPIHGLAAAKMAIPLRMALMSDNPNVWKTLGTIDSLTSLGLKNVNEFVDIVKAVKNSGILSDIRSTALFNVEDGALDLYKGYAREAISGTSTFFFNRGEEMSRLVSWEVSRREWMKVNPGRAWQENNALREISARQKEYNLGMQSHNTAMWQQGWAGIPMQFLQYNVKLMAALLHTGTQLLKDAQKSGWKALTNFENGQYRMFNPAQALSVLGTQLLFYGVAGNGLRGWANEIWGDESKLSEEQRMYISEGLAGGLIYTLTKELDGDPAKLALGKRLGSFEWYDTVFQKIVSDKGNMSDFLLGATKSNGVKVFDQVRNLARLFYYQEVTPEILLDTISKWPEVFASYSNALKAYTYMQNEGVVTSKDGTPIARINSKENLAAFIGISSVQVQEYYETVKDQTKLYGHLTDLAKEIHLVQQRQWKAVSAGDQKLADDLEKLRWAMMPRDPAHRRFVDTQLRTKLWPGDTATDKMRREFGEKMNQSLDEFRVLDK